MSTSGGEAEQPDSQQRGPATPRDLFDFYRRWAEFRPTAVSLADRSDLSASERQTIHWLVLLSDRISEHDLQPSAR
jgi:hypothetical protein